MAIRRSRLSRSSSSMKGAARLRRQIASELRGMPTERLNKYATLSVKVTAGNPVLSATKEVAVQELANRAGQLALWQKGGGALSKREAVREGAKKFFKLAGKVAKVYGKALSGEWQSELEESIATSGMKPKEQKAYIAKMRKERAKSPDMEPAFSADVPYEEFSVSKSASMIQKELKEAKRDAFI